MQASEWAPEFANGMSNHLPMALHALQQMQASEQQIDKFVRHYSRRLIPVAAQTDVQVHSWKDAEQLRGLDTAYLPLRDFFLTQLQFSIGKQNLLQFINQLAPGLSCSAFHPLIQLAHAIENQDTLQMANALAYWVMRYRELSWPENPQSSPESLSATIENLLLKHSWPQGRLGKASVADDMLQVPLQNNFNRLVFKPEVTALNLAAMEKSIIGLYLATDDFTILHGVTATYAVRVITKFSAEPTLLLEPLWQGLVTAYLSKGFSTVHHTNTLASLQKVSVYSVDELRQRACNSLDDHSIKLVAVCLKMYQITADDDYLLAASRKLKNDNSATQ
ncbi:MAG: questin oxidase family protein [Pseudomonadales bacterium]|nr:questin oxidase family protein [Pseudomonadales bacterium]